MSDSAIQYSTNKQLKVGLGEALQRLLRVEVRLMNGFSHVEAEDLAQRQLIIEALNQTQLDLGFDCNDDDVPDNIDIFEKAAQTSCCRVVPESQKPKKTRGRSRSAAAPSQQEAAEKVAPGPDIAFYDIKKEQPNTDQKPKEGEGTGPQDTKKKKGFLGGLFG